MSDLILHHYAMSPYAEKIRICMGIKGLTWKSVDAPMVTPLAATDAIEVARAAEPEVCSGEAVVPEGMAIGTPVLVLPDEYGSGNVAGALAASGLHEIAVRRETERAGTVVVHFPRETYGVIATG